MRLQHLEYLLKIAECKSITTASKELFMSQQALSRAIMDLEKELGASLLDRSYRGTSLTKDGEYLAQNAQDILILTDNIYRYFQKNHHTTDSNNKQTLRIMSVAVIKDYYLASTISHMWKYEKDITLSVFTKENNEIIEAIANQQCDLGFISTFEFNKKIQLTMPSDTIVFSPFNRLRFVALISQHSSLSKYKTLSIKHLMKHPLILMPSTILENYVPYQMLRYFGDIEPTIVDSMPLLLQLVADDVGWSFAIDPTPTLEPSHQDGLITRPLRDDIFSTMGYLRNTASPANEAIDKFLFHFKNHSAI